MKKSILGLILMALASAGLAQTRSTAEVKAELEAKAKSAKQAAIQAVTPSPLATSECDFTFSSGDNNTSLKYCVTANANIVQFEADGHSLISQMSLAEGYGLCDTNTGVEYYDYAGFGDSGNWGTAKVVSHSASSVKIARTTSDGVWTLTQTITRVAGNSPSAKVVMALKNNSATDRQAFLLRYADADVDGDTVNNFDATENDAFGWNSISSTRLSEPVGLALQNLQNPGGVLNQYSMLAQNTFSFPAPCTPFGLSKPGPLLAIDGSVVALYEPMVSSHKTATLTMAYKGM